MTPRLALAAACVAAAAWLGACGAAADALAVADDEGPRAAECVTSADCVLAATTCCGCPEFATPERAWDGACDPVMCPAPPLEDPDGPAAGCAPVAAACVAGACVVACEPVACDLTCAGGFAVDATGCLRCACADGSDAAPECAADDDCVRVPADCCGCARGGADAAAPAADAAARVAALGCAPHPARAACPEIDVCDPAAAPRCAGGRCVLAAPAPLDGACGRPDLPACPDGLACVLNADEEASAQGLGRCLPR